MNPTLTTLVKAWRDSGCPTQEAFDWSVSKNNWVKAFPNYALFISSLPEAIDRLAVREICESSSSAVIEKFLAVMIWGYGDRGYGPYRVTQMLNQPHAKQVLSDVFDLAQQGKPLAAYEHLKSNRIRNLGPSYGSKYVSFCTPRNIGAPIYDSFIALWISKFAPSEFASVPISSENWNVKTYSTYWSWIKEHSEELDCLPDDIELVIFRHAEREFSKKSSWQGK